jgi:hypothetical protein
MVLMTIFELKREEVNRGWRKSHNEELHNLYSSSNTITMITSRKVRWVEYLTHMGEKRNS